MTVTFEYVRTGHGPFQEATRLCSAIYSAEDRINEYRRTGHLFFSCVQHPSFDFVVRCENRISARHRTFTATLAPPLMGGCI